MDKIPPPTHCSFCNKPEVLWALYDWEIGYKPACGDCAVKNMHVCKEIVDSLAVWPTEGNTGQHGIYE